jgi:hypothetical protein
MRAPLRWVGLGAFGLAGVSLFWAFGIEPDRLIVRRFEVCVPGWPPELDRLRVAALADLHVGAPFVGLDKLRQVVAETNRTRANLVVLLGDYVIHGVRGGQFVEPEPIAHELRLLTAPLGVFAVLGNHDRWLDGPRVQHAFQSQGIEVLENRVTQIHSGGGRFWLAGLGDLWTGDPDVTGTLARVPTEAPLLCMTHNPDVFPSLPARVSLTLAGHTHGGQVDLPLLGRRIVPSKFGERYASGLIQEQGRLLFVTSGIGTSILPIRFRVPPEIAVLDLRACSTS